MRVTSVKNNNFLQLVTVATSAIFLVSCDASEPTTLRSANNDATIWLSPERPVPPAPLQITESSSQTSSAESTTKTTSLPPLMTLGIDDVCKGISFRDISGNSRSGDRTCGLKECKASGDKGCKITGTMRSVDIAHIEANKHDMTKKATILGITGTFDESAYQDCGKSSDRGCTVKGDLVAVKNTTIRPGIIKSGVKLGDYFTGDYPSATHPLKGYIEGKAQVTGAIKDALGSSEEHQFWTFDGRDSNLTGTPNFKGSNIITGNTIYGVGGTAPVPTVTNCEKVGDTDCFVSENESLLAVNTTILKAGHIKKGVTFLGVTGDYPSSANRLDGNSATADLDLSNYNQLGQSGTYEYFDNEGNRYTVSGNDQLKPGSIKKDVNILGQVGNLQGVDLSGVNAYDLRAGVAGIGKMDPNATCATKDDCVGDGKLWQDVSTSYGETQDCGSGSTNCYLYNVMLKQVWHFALKTSQEAWLGAANACEGSTHGSKDDWRLPTQKETLIASVHGLGKLGLYGYFNNGGSDRAFWTSTANSYDGSTNAYGRIAYTQSNDSFKTGVVDTEKKDIVCIRDVQNDAP